MNEYIRCSTCIQCNTDVAAAAKSLQLCLTLCDPIDDCLPGSSIPGILKARTLEWVAISSSNAWKWKVKVKSSSCVRLLLTLWIAAYQAPPSMGFSRQENWSGLPLPSPSGILFIHKKEWNNASCTNINGDYHTKWSKSERANILWYHLYVESKMWHKWNYIWNRNRLTDIDNRLVTAKGERVGRQNPCWD